MKSKPVSEAKQQRFLSIVQSCERHLLGAVVAKRKGTGKEVTLVCMLLPQSDGSVQPFPLATLCEHGDRFELPDDGLLMFLPAPS